MPVITRIILFRNSYLTFVRTFRIKYISAINTQYNSIKVFSEWLFSCYWKKVNDLWNELFHLNPITKDRKISMKLCKINYKEVLKRALNTAKFMLRMEYDAFSRALQSFFILMIRTYVLATNQYYNKGVAVYNILHLSLHLMDLESKINSFETEIHGNSQTTKEIYVKELKIYTKIKTRFILRSPCEIFGKNKRLC